MEILNDGFLKVFKNIHLYDSAKGSLYTWIRTIMINTAINFLQKKQLLFNDAPQSLPEDIIIENDILLKFDADGLLMLIRQLPPATQLVFNLHTVEGFSHREISMMLGTSESTSRWHLGEARKQLKQSLLQAKKYS
jgi:RNA polymerase sigma factor (sigma-70 family)